MDTLLATQNIGGIHILQDDLDKLGIVLKCIPMTHTRLSLMRYLVHDRKIHKCVMCKLAVKPRRYFKHQLTQCKMKGCPGNMCHVHIDMLHGNCINCCVYRHT